MTMQTRKIKQIVVMSSVCFLSVGNSGEDLCQYLRMKNILEMALGSTCASILGWVASDCY